MKCLQKAEAKDKRRTRSRKDELGILSTLSLQSFFLYFAATSSFNDLLYLYPFGCVFTTSQWLCVRQLVRHSSLPYHLLRCSVYNRRSVQAIRLRLLFFACASDVLPSTWGFAGLLLWCPTREWADGPSSNNSPPPESGAWMCVRRHYCGFERVGQISLFWRRVEPGVALSSSWNGSAVVNSRYWSLKSLSVTSIDVEAGNPDALLSLLPSVLHLLLCLLRFCCACSFKTYSSSSYSLVSLFLLVCYAFIFSPSFLFL